MRKRLATMGMGRLVSALGTLAVVIGLLAGCVAVAPGQSQAQPGAAAEAKPGETRPGEVKPGEKPGEGRAGNVGQAVGRGLQSASIPVQVAPAQTTTLQQKTTLTGDFQPVDRLQVVARVSARVTRLPVDIGESVAAGAVLAELDAASLEAGRQQAEAQLAVAQANLKKVEAGARPEDVEAAEAAARQAAERLAGAAAQAGGVRGQDLATAQAAVAAAEARLRQVTQGATEADIANAEAAIAAAEARLRQVTQGATEADIANAEAAVSAAEARLRAVTEGATVAEREQARAALRGAQAKYEQVLAGPRPQDIDIAVQALNQARENRLRLESALSFAKEQARLGLEQAASQVRSAQAQYAAAKLVYEQAASTGDDPNIPEESCPKQPNGRRLDCNDLTDPKLRQYKAAYESAEQALRQAEAAMETRRLAFEDAKKQEIVGLQQADAQILSAQATVDKIKAGATPEEIAAAKAGVDQARAAVDAIEGPARETDLAAAQAAVEQARAALDKVRQPARQPEIDAAQAAVTQARAALAKVQASPTEVGAAQAALEQAQALAIKAANPFLPADLEAAQAQVLVAEAAVTAAEVNLRDAAITAPFAGVVAAKNVSEGALAAPGTVLLEVISSDVRGVFTVEETLVGLMQLGQAATLTTTAYPGEPFAGVVSTINPTANASTRSFGIRITPQSGPGKLKAGMFAQAELVTQARQNVLAVPEAAVVSRDGKSILFTVADGTAQRREVSTGLRADGKVEITGGLQPGEQIVIVGQNLLNDGDAVTVR